VTADPAGPSPQALRPFDPALITDLADPYPVYANYRSAGAVHRGRSAPGRPDTWYVFGHRAAEHVLRGVDFVRTPPSGPGGSPPGGAGGVLERMVADWLVFMDPPRHTALRALLSRSFTPHLVRGLRPRIEEITRGLAEELTKAHRCDLVADFAAPLPVLVISELLGLPAERRDWFRAQAVALQEASTARTGRRPDGRARAEAAADALAEYFRARLRHRARHGGDDLIAALVCSLDPASGLTEDVAVATCVHLLTAGHETTTGLIGKTALALLRDPALTALVAGRPDLVQGATREFLRYDPPVQMVSRWARCDAPVAGRTVPGGARVLVVLGSASRDPAVFREPDVLDVRRAPGRLLAFGLGPHFCLGAQLALAEAEAALTALVGLLPGLRPAGPVVYEQDLVFHGPARIPLRPAGSVPN
jgi:cytochrome P450 StaP